MKEKKIITIVTTDLDGTFLDNEKKVPPINRQAVEKLKEKGEIEYSKEYRSLEKEAEAWQERQ